MYEDDESCSTATATIRNFPSRVLGPRNKMRQPLVPPPKPPPLPPITSTSSSGSIKIFSPGSLRSSTSPSTKSYPAPRVPQQGSTSLTSKKSTSTPPPPSVIVATKKKGPTPPPKPLRKSSFCTGEAIPPPPKIIQAINHKPTLPSSTSSALLNEQRLLGSLENIPNPFYCIEGLCSPVPSAVQFPIRQQKNNASFPNTNKNNNLRSLSASSSSSACSCKDFSRNTNSTSSNNKARYIPRRRPKKSSTFWAKKSSNNKKNSPNGLVTRKSSFSTKMDSSRNPSSRVHQKSTASRFIHSESSSEECNNDTEFELDPLPVSDDEGLNENATRTPSHVPTTPCKKVESRIKRPLFLGRRSVNSLSSNEPMSLSSPSSPEEVQSCSSPSSSSVSSSRNHHRDSAASFLQNAFLRRQSKEAPNKKSVVDIPKKSKKKSVISQDKVSFQDNDNDNHSRGGQQQAYFVHHSIPRVKLTLVTPEDDHNNENHDDYCIQQPHTSIRCSSQQNLNPISSPGSERRRGFATVRRSGTISRSALSLSALSQLDDFKSQSWNNNNTVTGTSNFDLHTNRTRLDFPSTFCGTVRETQSCFNESLFLDGNIPRGVIKQMSPEAKNNSSVQMDTPPTPPRKTSLIMGHCRRPLLYLKRANHKSTELSSSTLSLSDTFKEEEFSRRHHNDHHDAENGYTPRIPRHTTTPLKAQFDLKATTDSLRDMVRHRIEKAKKSNSWTEDFFGNSQGGIRRSGTHSSSSGTPSTSGESGFSSLESTSHRLRRFIRKKSNKIQDIWSVHTNSTQEDSLKTSHLSPTGDIASPSTSSPALLEPKPPKSKGSVLTSFFSESDPTRRPPPKKEFLNATLDLGSGQVRSTKDGKVLFTLPFSLQNKQQQQKQQQQSKMSFSPSDTKRRSKSLSSHSLEAAERSMMLTSSPPTTSNNPSKDIPSSDSLQLPNMHSSSTNGDSFFTQRKSTGTSEHILQSSSSWNKLKKHPDYKDLSPPPQESQNNFFPSYKNDQLLKESRGEYGDHQESGSYHGALEDTSSITSTESGSSTSIKDANTTFATSIPSLRSKNDEDFHRVLSYGTTDDISCSLNGGIPSPSYEGPFKGSAVAIKDITPSPYDKGALSFKKGDVVQIIATKPTGVWVGKANGQVGHFKFINVRVENLDRSVMVPSSKIPKEIISNSRTLSSSSSSLEERPLTSLDTLHGNEDESLVDPFLEDLTTVNELLQRIRLQNYVVLFETEGFETLDLFKDLEPEDLDRLGIFDTSHRAKLLQAARTLKNPQNEIQEPSESASFTNKRRTSRNKSTTGFGESSTSSNNTNNRFGVQLPYQFEYYNPPVSSNLCKHPAEVKASVEVHTTEVFPRDSGVYVGRDEGEDTSLSYISGSYHLPLETESEEIILSPMNLSTRMTSRSDDTTDITRAKGNHKNAKDDEEPSPDPYEGVRSRFLEHKNFFESVGVNAAAAASQNSTRNSLSSKANQNPSETKSSDSGISVNCANSPTSPVAQRKEYRT